MKLGDILIRNIKIDNKNKIISDINKDEIIRQLKNYLRIKSEIDTFPLEFQCKILQYARDVSYLPNSVDLERIRLQLFNEALSLEQAHEDTSAQISNMERNAKQQLPLLSDHDKYAQHNVKLELTH